jgi:hypothetical protein
MFLLLIAFVAIITASLPLIVPRVASKLGFVLHSAPAWLPILAALVYASAPFLPHLHFTTETDTFQEHFVGGGVYTTLLYIYFTRLAGWRPRWWVVLLTLYAWTSALGVFNELVEITLVKLNITGINISDTSWDLVANTTGMLTTFIIWRFIVWFNNRR